MPKGLRATREPRILTIRGHHVVLDSDLALLYGVTTGNFNKAIKRNQERFPDDFSFMLPKRELARRRNTRGSP